MQAALAAPNSSALIAQQLDTQIKSLTLDGSLPQVMQTIGKETGVPVEAAAGVWDLLPWGEQTTVQAKVENQTLRATLDAIAGKLGLVAVLGDEAVELRPAPPLARLGRRATVQELTAIDLLMHTPLGGAQDHVSAQQLLSTIDDKLASTSSPFAVENRAYDATRDATVSVARNATLYDALEAIATQTSATWYPWGKSLVVLSKRDHVRTLLNKTITARYNGVDVGQVLLELFQRSGVEFTVEPGAYEKVPATARTIKLLLDNATVQQALESISGFTGLSYSVTDAGVHIAYGSGPISRP